MGAVLKTAKVQEGDTVAIFGLAASVYQPLSAHVWQARVASLVLISTKVNST